MNLIRATFITRAVGRGGPWKYFFIVLIVLFKIVLTQKLFPSISIDWHKHRSAPIESVAMSKQRLRWWFLNFPQLRDISYSNIFNVHNPGKACTESFFNPNTAHLWPSVFCWKFVFICIVLSYLTVDTHTIHICTLLCTGHFLADAGEREVNLLETWDIKPFA